MTIKKRSTGLREHPVPSIYLANPLQSWVVRRRSEAKFSIEAVP
jgi:hypothetical protein